LVKGWLPGRDEGWVCEIVGWGGCDLGCGEVARTGVDLGVDGGWKRTGKGRALLRGLKVCAYLICVHPRRLRGKDQEEGEITAITEPRLINQIQATDP